ncbi:uncharacterized protein LOC113344718 [Papaver somniferum]|uniref:uncharacterized protein LOC113344718 n=1 Tax=Papaver somniferum TaxID=3469 RepID=UPI000E6F90E3|nr:uncharacterized protein LOC113344718 [Papaver somniferum]
MVAPTCKDLQDTNNTQQGEIDSLHLKVNQLALQITTTSTKEDVQTVKIEIEKSMQSLRSEFEKTLKSQLAKFFSNNRDSGEAEGSTGGFSHTEGNNLFAHTNIRDPHSFHRIPKLDFPRFDGENPKSWIQKCEYYFQMQGVPDVNRTRMAAIHLDGKATKWYDNLCITQPHISWKCFCENLCARFENPAHDNIVGLFNKLVQLTTVEAYFEEFEYLKALLLSVHPQFPETYFIASFIGGLKEELRGSILMFNPQTLLNAFSLARMQEQTLSLQHRVTKYPQKQIHTPSNSSRPFNSTSFTSTPPPHPAPTPPVPKSNTTIPLKKLTPEQVQARKAQGLCSSEQEDELIMDTEEAPAVESDMEISLHALTGTVSADTIRIPGILHKKLISILIDTGSTNSFIDSSLAKEIQCLVTHTASLLVTVANGEKTISSGICSQLNWSMQGHKFCGDLRLIPLGGCDIVLGVDWLKNLGDCKKITLTGDPQKTSLSMMSGSAVKKFLQKHSHGLVGQLFFISSQPPPSPPPQISSLLTQYKDVIDVPTKLPSTRALYHKIPLKPNSEPVNLRPYRSPYLQKAVVESLVKEMLQTGIIQPSNSLFASPILLVKKKDNSWRFCVDYRKLNSLTIKDKFPILVIDELLDELHGSKFFTKIDLKSGYHQIRVSPADIHKTAFRTHHGHFEFKVMPFGLTNAPATFQALMNHIFQDHLRSFIFVFFDDILVYSPTMESHLIHLQTTLDILRANQLTANISKCSFGHPEIEYLGHIITGNGFMADPDKISAMVDWPIPTNITGLRGFLGLTGYYRKFVKNYGIISRPLTALLRKNSFHWSPATKTAFNALKLAMTTKPVLALPDFNKQFTLETDACDSGIGVVLMQDQRAISFYSKPLGPRAATLSTYEKELLAIVQAVTRWKQYLQGSQFIIKTDHQSIQYFLEQKIFTMLQQKWLIKLLGFDYVIHYKRVLKTGW